MSKIETYHSLKEYLAIPENNISLPDVDTKGCSVYYNDFDDYEDLAEQFTEAISYFIDCLENKYIYYYTKIGRGYQTLKIHKYYKLWKSLERSYNLAPYILGGEYEIEHCGESIYCGVLEVEAKEIQSILQIMAERDNMGFLYITEKAIDIWSKAIKDDFEKILLQNSVVFHDFDYVRVYEYAEKDSYIVNIQKDGEIAAMYVGKRL